MIEYKILSGTLTEVEQLAMQAIADGYTLQGLTSTTIGSVVKYSQSITRTIDTSSIVEPVATSRRLKK